MIDILNAIKVFEEYVKPYDVSNGRILLKVRHTFRTVDVAKRIAEELRLSKEQIDLASLIGLLHDIGRFEQIRIYNTFRDKDSIDHADLGVKILFEDGIIRKFIEEKTYDDIIYKAIKNHNKFKIEEGLNSEELLQAKIIRDADKTDIFEAIMVDIEENRNVICDYEQASKQIITPEFMEAFRKCEQVNKEQLKKEIDLYINHIAFLFDYNFVPGLKIVKEKKYIERMVKPLCICEDTKAQMYEVMEIANKYINERIEKGS